MKIAPEYGQTTVHVLDASRVVDVVSNLLNDAQRPEFERGQPRAAADAARAAQRAARASAAVRTTAALENRLKIDWAHETLPTPAFIGRRVLIDVPLDELVPLHRLDVLLRRLGAEGPVSGDSRPSAVRRRGARAVRQRARAARSHHRRDSCSRRAASTGSGRRRSEGDDIVVYADATATRRAGCGSTCCASRRRFADGKPNLSLADFVADRDRRRRRATTSARSR